MLNFRNIPKGGAKRGGRSLWMLMNIGSQLQKWKKFTISALEVWIRKGVQKGGHHSRMLVPIIYTMIRCSDACFRGQICIFWYSHYVNSSIIICPPFASPFSSFHFLKNLQPQIFPESKINFVRPLDPNIKGFEFKKFNFCKKMAKRGIKYDFIVKENHRFCLTITSN